MGEKMEVTVYVY